MTPLTWFESPRVNEEGLPWCMWFLADDSGRILATVEVPTAKAFAYTAQSDGKSDRLYVHLAGAKEYAEKQARIILTDDIKQRALNRRKVNDGIPSRTRSA